VAWWREVRLLNVLRSEACPWKGHGQTAAPEAVHRLDHTTLLGRMLFAGRLRFMDTFKAAGKVTGHAKLEADGKVDKAAGKARSTIGDLKDTRQIIQCDKAGLPTGLTDFMKIAQIAPLYEAVPPSLYGGTERIVAHLTNALVELGHEVTLFASAEADTRATLVPVRDQAIRLDRFPLKSDLAAHLSMLHELHLRRHEFDLLHFHVDLIHFPFFEDCAERTVTTLHTPCDPLTVFCRPYPAALVPAFRVVNSPVGGGIWLLCSYRRLPLAQSHFRHLRPLLVFQQRQDCFSFIRVGAF
jgi:hypothetical protein